MWCLRACFVFIPVEVMSLKSAHLCRQEQIVLLYSTKANSPTFPTFCAQEVPDIVVYPEVLLQHVLPGKGFVTLVTAMALHT